MKNILVTGGFGFIGFNALSSWAQKFPKLNFVNMDCETYAAQFKLDEKKEILRKLDIKSMKKSICDNASVDEAVKSGSIDTIVNFCAETHVDNSISGPMPFFSTNIVGTANLLEACRKYGCRLHQVSTDEVIGAVSPESGVDSTEEAKLDPSSPYSSSKASAELVAMSYFKTFGIPVTISRCTNNIGPWQHPEKLVPKAILNALDGKKIPIYGNGGQRRFWIDVESHNDALMEILQHGKAGQTYNIAPNPENLLKNIDIVKMILENLGKDESLVEHVQDRAAHDICYWLDASKIQSELGWKDGRDFRETLSKTIDWYKSNGLESEYRNG